MNTAEFLAALHTVEQDHRVVLEKVQVLKELVGGLLDPDDEDAQKHLRRCREVKDYFNTEFEAHMQEEERTLFSSVEQFSAEGAALVAGLRSGHDEVRRRLAEFANCLQVASELQDQLPRAVVRDLLTCGWNLWEVLDSHAHTESRAVRQCLVARAGENAAGALRDRLRG